MHGCVTNGSSLYFGGGVLDVLGVVDVLDVNVLTKLLTSTGGISCDTSNASSMMFVHVGQYLAPLYAGYCRAQESHLRMMYGNFPVDNPSASCFIIVVVVICCVIPCLFV